MTKRVAYLANEFPSAVEPYVMEEIRELRRAGVEVIPCSARTVGAEARASLWSEGEILNLRRLRIATVLRAAWIGLHSFRALREFLVRIFIEGDESFSDRTRALSHTLLGLYYAALLGNRRVKHIHVHHGYFSSWIGMVAARILGIHYSVTLHGSDLLLSGAYMDTKLQACDFCFTISEFNREFIRHAYPAVNLHKVLVQRLGVNLQSQLERVSSHISPFLILAVGRLHKVKDHAFLIRACREFRDRGNQFLCLIGGDGPERKALEQLIDVLDLKEHVRLLGALRPTDVARYYELADLVVLTSRSEGIPLVFMEAMAHGRVVLGPAITGLPELVINGVTGFLYRPGSLDDFVAKLEYILASLATLEPVRREARRHVAEHFNREKNLAAFREQFLSHVAADLESVSHADPVLQ